MRRLRRAATALIAMSLLIGAVPGQALTPPPTQEAQSIGAQATAAPLLLDCSAITSSPAHCAFGYVYYDGDPVVGAQVEITSSYGTLNTATADGSLSGQPYYQADLSGAPLLVSPGDTITVTASYHGSSASVGYQVAPGGQQVDVVIAASPLFGTGVDGDLTIGSGQTSYTDNTRSSLAATASSGQNQMSLSSASGFAAGREVLIIQMQGTGAGNYEFGTIASVNVNTLILNDTLNNAYTVGGNSKAQVLQVPYFRSVAVANGGNLTAHTWDGSTGSVISFKVNGLLDVQLGGSIDARAIGFRGGQERVEAWPAQTGESYVGPSTYSQSANGGGGGGGNNEGSGGGGGYANVGGVGSGSGPGAAGGAYGTPDLSRVFLGSGGGGGMTNALKSGGSANGASGGGAVIIWASQVSVNGSVVADGGSASYLTDSANRAFGGGGGVVVRFSLPHA